uniref:Minichromosome loss protein Mcl1 middle region domain-containing protein n=1 Tax=Trichuris muris TaxID=70415 RepID=A0A5S6QWP7_TRIMR
MPLTVPLRYGHSDGITSISVDQKLRHIVTVGAEGQLRFWKNFEDDVPETYDVADELTAVAVYGDTVLVATEKSVVNAHVAATGELDSTVARFSLPITHMVASRSGHLLVASSDFQVRWISLLDKTYRPLEGHEAPVLSVAVDPLGIFASTACGDGCLRIWQLSDVKCECIKTLRILPKVNEFRLTHPLARMDWCPDLSGVLAVPAGKEVQIYDRNDWSLTKKYTVENSDASICCYDSIGARLAVACMDGSIVVWDAFSGDVIFSDVHPRGRALCALFWNPFIRDQLLLADVCGYVGGFKCIPKPGKLGDSSTAIFADEEQFDVGDHLPAISDDENSADFDISRIKSTWLNDRPTESSAESKLTLENVASLLKNWQASLSPKPFSPGSTPFCRGEHYMKWNRVGMIKHYANREMGDVIDVEFHNVSLHQTLHFQNEVTKYSIGDLSEEAVALASYEHEDSGSQVFISHFASWYSAKEWYIDVPFGESVQCLCLGKGWVAFTTSSRLLRVYTLSGVLLWTSTIESQVVAMSARGLLLFLVYHEGIALSGHPRLHYSAYMFDEASAFYGVISKVPHSANVVLSADASLTWLCVTEQGTFCTADSVGIVRILVNGAWVPIRRLNEPDKIDQEFLWPVDLLEETTKILCVCCKRSKVPALNPKPAMVYVPWKMPVCHISHIKSDNGELALMTNVKRQLLRHANFAVGRSNSKDAGIDKGDICFLLKTFAVACKAERYEFALDLASLSTTEANLNVFLRYACDNHCNVLVERLESLRRERYDKGNRRSQNSQKAETEFFESPSPLSLEDKQNTLATEEEEQRSAHLSFSFALSPDRSPCKDDTLSELCTPTAGSLLNLPTPSPGRPYNPFKKRQTTETELTSTRSVFDLQTPKKRRPTLTQLSETEKAKKLEKAQVRTIDALFKSATSTQASTNGISDASQDLFPNMVCQQSSNTEKDPFTAWFDENREAVVRDFSGDGTDDKALLKFALSQYRQRK